MGVLILGHICCDELPSHWVGFLETARNVLGNGSIDLGMWG